MKSTTQKTDQECALSAQSGRKDFEGWLSSSTTVAAGIAGGAPMVPVGDPVFYEPLAVATDKSGPPHAELQAELDKIIKEMHADGTLSTFGEEVVRGPGPDHQAVGERISTAARVAGSPRAISSSS